MIQYFKRQRCLIQKLNGSAKVFSIMETLCFPISIATISAVLIHSCAVVVVSVSSNFGCKFWVPELPGWVSCILVAAAVGYLTNYIAIQMLYYPISNEDLQEGEGSDKSLIADKVEAALHKSKVVSWSTFGFWGKGLIPRNRGKVAWQIGLIAEERFVTPETISMFLPKLTRALLTRNDQGKIRGVEIIRGLVANNRDQAAETIRGLLIGFIKNGDKDAIRVQIAKIGRSEAVATALTAALLTYLRENPESVVASVREMVASFTKGYAKPRHDENDSLLSGLSQVMRGVTGAVIEGVTEIGSSQIKSFIESFDTNPERRRSVREKLERILPELFDRIGERVVKNPALLEEIVSGDVIDHLINVKIDDEVFWNDLGERLAPEMDRVVTRALQGMSQKTIRSFLGEDHPVAETIKETIMRMNLLDFYKMLDDVMAEHLGAIQVFGFVLGAIIGYVQYSIVLLHACPSVAHYLMMGIPIICICGMKLLQLLYLKKERI